MTVFMLTISQVFDRLWANDRREVAELLTSEGEQTDIYAKDCLVSLGT